MTVRVAVGVVINRRQEVLIAQRKKHQHLGGMWEFPGGKMEEGETPQAALTRELKEEVGIDVLASEPLTTITHHYPEKTVKLIVFLVENYRGVAEGREAQIIQWLALKNLPALAFPEANIAIIELLLQRFVKTE